MVWISFGVLALVSLVIAVFHEPRFGLVLFLATLPVIVVYAGFVLSHISLIRDPAGELKERIQLANILTALRIFMVVPVLVLLIERYWLWALAVYLLGAVTDIFDGLVARRFRQVTVLGVLLDPVGDILITGTVFTFFWLTEEVPFWLFIILMVRYVQFFVGLAVLRLLKVEPELRATMAGKVVGVIQATGIVILIGAKWYRGGALQNDALQYLFPVLGIAFASVIVSQTVIGIKALHRLTVSSNR
ncbi:MAG: CDP-alcohol phosphatidyltransferase family protein [bacterium]|nr:MAG: CDP-alcohol phosphatidyltransferase family protein [bacterium]